MGLNKHRMAYFCCWAMAHVTFWLPLAGVELFPHSRKRGGFTLLSRDFVFSLPTGAWKHKSEELMALR